MNEEFRFKLWGNQAGMSLIEIMIAAGLAGVVALVVASMTKNSQKAVKGVEYSTEVTRLSNQIASILRDEINCGLTLQGLNANGSSNLTQIKFCSQTELVDDTEIAANGDTTPPKKKVCAAGKESVAFDVASDDFKRSFGNLFTLQLDFVGSGSGTTATGNLVLYYTKVGAADVASFGGKNHRTKIPIMYEVGSDNRIAKCYNNETNMINTAVARACQGQGAQLLGAGTSDDPYRCDINVGHQLDTTECASDEVVVAFKMTKDANGNDIDLAPVCKPFVEVTGCNETNGYFYRLADTNEVVCRSLPPKCPPGQILMQADNGGSPAGFLECVPLNNCLINGELPRARLDGTLECFNCSTGQVAVKLSTGWACKSISCDPGPGEPRGTQKYFTGFNTATGNAICNPLITNSDELCPNGGKLAVAADGSVKMECCTQACGDTSRFCLNEPYPEPNGCGTCFGSYQSQWDTPDSSFIEALCPASRQPTAFNRTCNDAHPSRAGQTCGNCNMNYIPFGNPRNTQFNIYCPIVNDFFTDATYNDYFIPSNIALGSLRVFAMGGGGGGGGGSEALLETKPGSPGEQANLYSVAASNVGPNARCQLLVGAGSGGSERSALPGQYSQVYCNNSMILQAAGGAGGNYKGGGNAVQGSRGEPSTREEIIIDSSYRGTPPFMPKNIGFSYGGSGGSGENNGGGGTGYGAGGGAGGGDGGKGGGGTGGFIYLQWKQY